jgi:hypothetical protein
MTWDKMLPAYTVLCMSQMPQTAPSLKVVRQSAQRNALGKNTAAANGSPDTPKKMALDRAHSAERAFQHHQTGARLEPSRETKTRAPKRNMEAKPDERTEDSKPHLKGSQENRQRPQKVEEDSRGPMLHKERRGLSK